jgi:quercetin dioxygenase-like cupin family protein
MRLPAVILPFALIACFAEQTSAAVAITRQQTGAAAMQISRSDTRKPTSGSAEWFSGTVTVTPLSDPNETSKVGAALVRFEPGARTAWHKHPLGQRLVVTEGSGWTQVDGGPVEVIRAGDVVWCPPGVRHWHGATADTAMAHIAIQEAQNGSPVTWMEHVSETDYLKGPR